MQSFRDNARVADCQSSFTAGVSGRLLHGPALQYAVPLMPEVKRVIACKMLVQDKTEQRVSLIFFLLLCTG